MPVPNSEFDQFTGHRPADIAKILIAFLNAVFDSGSGMLRTGTSFERVGAHQRDTTVSSATVLTAPAGATKLMIQAVTQNCRYTLDGSTPTNAQGFLLRATDLPSIFPIAPGTVVTVIEVTASASVEFQWGR